jgi:hypothetical protein
MSTPDATKFQCCFCGDTIASSEDPYQISASKGFFFEAGQPSESFWCHSQCLKQKLHPSVPFDPELWAVVDADENNSNP